MIELAILIRAMQIYAHGAHNSISGPTFFADHPKLGELYDLYTELYDSIIERTIGLWGIKSINIDEVQTKAIEKANAIEMAKPNEIFKALLTLERELCSEIKDLKNHKDMTDGAIQLVTGIADNSEARQYQFKQRLA